MPASFPQHPHMNNNHKAMYRRIHPYPHTGNMVSCRSLELTGHSAQLSSGVDPVRNIGQMRTPSVCLYMHTWKHTHTRTAAHTHTDINTLHMCMREEVEKNTSVEATGENHTGNTSLWALVMTLWNGLISPKSDKWQLALSWILKASGPQMEQSAEWGDGPHNGRKALPDVHLTGP